MVNCDCLFGCGNSSPNLVSTNDVIPNDVSPKTFHPITFQSNITFHPIHVSPKTTFHPKPRFTQITFHPTPVSPKLHLLESFTQTKCFPILFWLYKTFIFEFTKVVYIRTQLIFYSSTAQFRHPLEVKTCTPWWSWDWRFGVQP